MYNTKNIDCLHEQRRKEHAIRKDMYTSALTLECLCIHSNSTPLHSFQGGLKYCIHKFSHNAYNNTLVIVVARLLGVFRAYAKAPPGGVLLVACILDTRDSC